MKKMVMLAISIFIAGFIVSPFLGMAISPTRELILGLAPDQAVLELADKIEENNNDILSQIEIIEEQKNKIVELENLLNKQGAALSSQKIKLDETKENLSKIEEKASICGEIIYYENQYSIKNRDGKYTSFVKCNKSVVECEKQKGWIEKNYEDDNTFSDKDIKFIINQIEKDYQKYLLLKEKCE